MTEVGFVSASLKSTSHKREILDGAFQRVPITEANTKSLYELYELRGHTGVGHEDNTTWR